MIGSFTDARRDGPPSTFTYLLHQLLRHSLSSGKTSEAPPLASPLDTLGELPSVPYIPSLMVIPPSPTFTHVDEYPFRGSLEQEWHAQQMLFQHHTYDSMISTSVSAEVGRTPGDVLTVYSIGNTSLFRASRRLPGIHARFPSLPVPPEGPALKRDHF